MTNTPIDPRRRAWEAGNYSTAADQSLLVSELLCEAVDLRANELVLDVACGTGVTAFAAARRKGIVTGIDFSTNALEIARRRAAFERLEIDFQEGNAEELPFEPESFDVVLSTFGAQFVENQHAAAQELIRVCKPDGRIGLANWTPKPYFGHFFKLMVDYAPKQMKKNPTPEQPGVLWGTEERLHELFGSQVEFVQLQERVSRSRYRSVDEIIEGTTKHLGPVLTIFEGIDEAQQQAFISDLRDLAERFNQSSGPDVLLESSYFEVVMHRR